MKTRIAPSPTGWFHIGTLRTAYLNYLAAKSLGGEFILRIDDTDKLRSEQRYASHIIETVADYSIPPDRVFYQSDHKEGYKYLSHLLIQDGLARREDGCIRNDDMVLIKSDGNPTYNFATVHDDYYMEIDCIIRGVDHISNLPLQQRLWKDIGKVFTEEIPFPKVYHVGLLFEDGKKLSKREGNGNVESYKDYDKQAVLNWLLRLGWSMPDPNFDKNSPIVNQSEAMELFWKGNLQSNNCNVNTDKLKWYDKQYRKIAKQNLLSGT